MQKYYVTIVLTTLATDPDDAWRQAKEAAKRAQIPPGESWVDYVGDDEY